MAALLTDQFRIFTAQKFIKSLEGPDPLASDTIAGDDRDRLYLFIGRPQEWDNENSPPQAVDSFDEFSDAYDDMMSLKRVLAADTIQVVRRIDWIPPEQTTGGLGFTYDMYRHDYSPTNTASSGATKLYDSDFYVVNSTTKFISASITALLLVTLTVAFYYWAHWYFYFNYHHCRWL